METKRLTLLAVLLALSVIINIVERVVMLGITSLLGPFFAPLLGAGGLRIGLANIVVLLVLYTYGTRDAFAILFMRVFLVGLLYTALFSVPFFTSLVGGAIAFTLMVLFKSLKGFSLISVSIMGAVGHVMGQMIVAVTIFGFFVIAYFPLMVLISIPAGFVVGKITIRMIEILKPITVKEY